ncbi:hypothetical protein [Cupriavidus alkaliphilus]|uniref:hypothetical protein n=1 Tax=Cupriavidus alkaliphilus TaxID=942866 RepID=UPI00339D8658
MEEIEQQGGLALVSRWTALALLAVSVHAQADVDAPVPKGMQRYIIPIKGCAVEFVAKAGGYTDITRSGPLASGYFQHGNYYPKDRHSREMSFSISCQYGNARELCPREMRERRESDPMMIRDTQQRDLTSLTPRYYSDASVATATAVATPRSRDLHFCLGDETRTIVTMNGGIVVGFDPREITETRGQPILKRSEHALPDVLAIIRSMRFVPDPAPKQDSR